MRNPTAKQFDKVIGNLTKALEMAKGNAPVDMGDGSVNAEKNFCGTPACHGGWYAIATLKKLSNKDFSDGALKMAEHLGFKDESELESWANENPTLWGNKFGSMMFYAPDAFCSRRDLCRFGLQAIIDHWKGVKERTVAIR